MRAKRRTKFSLRDLFWLAFSTRLMMREAVDSLKFLVTFTRMTPDRLMHPLFTASPWRTSRGMLSPVRASVLSEVAPSVMMPSRGIFSPGRTTMVSPTLTSCGDTSLKLPLRSTVALSGRMSIRQLMESRLLSSA